MKRNKMGVNNAHFCIYNEYKTNYRKKSLIERKFKSKNGVIAFFCYIFASN